MLEAIGQTKLSYFFSVEPLKNNNYGPPLSGINFKEIKVFELIKI